MNEEAARAIFACSDRYDLKKLLAKWKQQSLNARMNPDPAFATSPIFVTDKDYDFSVDTEIICSDPTRMDQVSVLKCHPWIGMLTHTVLEDL